MITALCPYKVCFETYDSFMKSYMFQETTFLKIEDYDADVIPRLPPSLQMLVCTHSLKLSTFPELPLCIRSVTITNGSLSELPDLSKFDRLETLNVHGNCIQHMKNPLPPGLMSFDVSYNQLRCISDIPPTLVELNVEYNFLTGRPNVQKSCLVHDRGNEYPWIPSIQKKDVYGNSENVHVSSVQKTIDDSVNIINNMTKNMFIPQDGVAYTLDYIYPPEKPLPNPKPAKKQWWWCCKAQDSPEDTPDKNKEHLELLLEEWCECRDIHSIHGIVFEDLLRRVVCIAQKHEHAETIRDILKDELLASEGLCFTGRFSRVVNVLVGFVDGICVSISEREQLQARMAQVSTMLDIQIQVAEAMKVLTEYGHPEEWKAWIDALDIQDLEDFVIDELCENISYPRRQWTTVCDIETFTCALKKRGYESLDDFVTEHECIHNFLMSPDDMF